MMRIPLLLREMSELPTVYTTSCAEGRTRMGFLISAASEKAKKVITEHRSIQLSLREQKMLADVLVNGAIKEADDFLKGIREEYHAQVKPR